MRDLSLELALSFRLEEARNEIAKLERTKGRAGDLGAFDLGRLVALRSERDWLEETIRFHES